MRLYCVQCTELDETRSEWSSVRSQCLCGQGSPCIRDSAQPAPHVGAPSSNQPTTRQPPTGSSPLRLKRTPETQSPSTLPISSGALWRICATWASTPRRSSCKLHRAPVGKRTVTIRILTSPGCTPSSGAARGLACAVRHVILLMTFCVYHRYLVL